MEEKIHKRKVPKNNNYHKHEIDLAVNFSREIKKEAQDMIRGVILFGSTARREKDADDIDLLIIIDDIHIIPEQHVLEAYRIIVDQLRERISPKLHITTLKFTSFWEYVRAGDPVAINILRDGVALIDTGFFDPLQALLFQGRIRPSMESIWTYYSRAPKTLHNSRAHVLQAIIDLYWAAVDAAHAALMSLGEIPPSPQHVPDLMDEKMVKTGKLDKKYLADMRDIYGIAKKIMHHQLHHISGNEYDEWFVRIEKFVDAMRKFIV